MIRRIAAEERSSFGFGGTVPEVSTERPSSRVGRTTRARSLCVTASAIAILSSSRGEHDEIAETLALVPLLEDPLGCRPSEVR